MAFSGSNHSCDLEKATSKLKERRFATIGEITTASLKEHKTAQEVVPNVFCLKGIILKGIEYIFININKVTFLFEQTSY